MATIRSSSSPPVMPACFLNAMKFIALKSRSSFPADASVTATVGIGANADGGFGLAISLSVSLPGLSDADAKNLMAQADKVCPYSNATRNNIDVKLGLG